MFSRRSSMIAAAALGLAGSLSLGTGFAGADTVRTPVQATPSVADGAGLPVQGPGYFDCWGPNGWNSDCGTQPQWGPGMMGPGYSEDGQWGPGMMAPGYHHGGQWEQQWMAPGYQAGQTG